MSDKFGTYFYLPDPERTPQNPSLLRSTCLDNALAPWLSLQPFTSTKRIKKRFLIICHIGQLVSKEFTTMYCGTFGLYGSIKEESRTDLGGGRA